MILKLHKKAEKEALSSFKYYSKINESLGTRFRDEMDDRMIAISNNPFLCHNRGGGIYSVRLKTFPYSIFYKIKSAHIRVLAILHDRRNPNIWRRRR